VGYAQLEALSVKGLLGVLNYCLVLANPDLMIEIEAVAVVP
jgi:hypothetical protein